MALPAPTAGYVASASEVARLVGLDPDALTDAQETSILDAILDMQGVVQASLNRDSLFPVRATVASQYPDTTYSLTAWQAWPTVLDSVDDVFAVVSSTLEADGTYTVVVDVGIDARVILPIRRWVVRAAAEQLRGDPDSGIGTRQVSSLSAEGQSVSFEKPSDAAGAAGNVPPVASLKRWRRIPAYVRETPSTPTWPYGGPNITRW